MSSAFRNFFLTFILSLAVFVLAAIKLLPLIKNVIIDPPEESSSETSEQSIESTDPPIIKQQSDWVNYLFIGKNTDNRVCSINFIRITKDIASEEDKNNYISVIIDPSSYIRYASRYVPLYALIAQNDENFMIEKISALVGYDIDYYFITTPEKSLKALDFYKNVGSGETLPNISINLTFSITYIDPEFAGLPDAEEYKRILEPGKITIDKENLLILLNGVPENNPNYDYLFQRNVYKTLYDSIFGISSVSMNANRLIEILSSFDTNLGIADAEIYMSNVFKRNDLNFKEIIYKTSSVASGSGTVMALDVFPTIDEIQLAGE